MHAFSREVVGIDYPQSFSVLEVWLLIVLTPGVSPIRYGYQTSPEGSLACGRQRH